MRHIACTLLFGIALIPVSACTTMPGGAGAAPKTSQTASCDWLEGYPDCRVPGAGHHAKPAANLAEAPAS